MVFTSLTYRAFVFSSTTVNQRKKQYSQSRTVESRFARPIRPRSRNTWRVSSKQSQRSNRTKPRLLAMNGRESQNQSASSLPSCNCRARADASEAPTSNRGGKEVPDTPFRTIPSNRCTNSRYECEAAVPERVSRAFASTRGPRSPCRIRQSQRRSFAS